MRLIDADALIMALRLEYPMMPMFKENQKEWGIKTEGYRKAEEVIKDAPSIDIVICKECKRGKPYSDKQLECDALGLGGLKFPNDFCSYGEPNSSEKPNNCEPKICDTCRYYNSNIPCGSTPSACKEADKFAEEFVDGLKKLKPKVEPQTSPTISKMEQVEDEQITSKLIDIENSAVSGYESTMSQPKSKLKDEPQTEECEEPNYYDPALWE